MTTKSNAKPAAPTKCLCGCGNPANKKFVVGHDARLKSALLATLREGTPAAKRKATTTLADLDWVYANDRISKRRAGQAPAAQAQGE